MNLTKTEAHVLIGKLMDKGFEVSSRTIPQRDPEAELQFYIFTIPFYTYASGKEIKEVIALADEYEGEVSMRSKVKGDSNFLASFAEMDMVIQ